MEYIQNLTLWNNTLNLTNIKFMYFHASDLKSPKVRTAFKKFGMKGRTYYVTNGESNNFWYIYQETIIKYLVNLKPTSDAEVFDVDILGSGGDVNHGDHVDFSIIRLRNQDTLIKTHKTVYMDIGNCVFDRSVQECNFVFTDAKLNNLENTFCERIGSVLNYRMSDVYEQTDIDVIKYVCNTMLLDNYKKKKHAGGSFLGSSDVIYELVVKPLMEVRSDVLSVQVLHGDRRNSITVLIDFIEYTRSILLLKWPIQNAENVVKAINTLILG